jgi:hypothetical protein
MIKEISPIIYGAIERLRLSFGGTNVELLSEEMYRKTPTEHSLAGDIGVDVKIEGVTVFLSCPNNAEDIACTPYGQMLADEFVHMVLKTAYLEKFK